MKNLTQQEVELVSGAATIDSNGNIGYEPAIISPGTIFPGSVWDIINIDCTFVPRDIINIDNTFVPRDLLNTSIIVSGRTNNIL